MGIGIYDRVAEGDAWELLNCDAHRYRLSRNN